MQSQMSLPKPQSPFRIIKISKLNFIINIILIVCIRQVLHEEYRLLKTKWH